MATIRTFTAVAIPKNVRKQAIQLADRLRGAGAEVRWVADENLHWTLKFLGEVVDREIGDVCRVVAEAAAQVAPFELQAIGAGAFPNAHMPRTLYLGTERGMAEMETLYEAVTAGLATLGYGRESRRFRPHLTLGRLRGGQGIGNLAELLHENANFNAGAMTVREVLVLGSQPGRGGPEYHVLGRGRLLAAF